MKIDNLKLINICNTLEKYAEMHLPQKISYAITRNIMATSKELNVYNKSLEKIMAAYDPYTVKNEAGENILLAIGVPKVDDEHMKDYIAEINDLLAIEVEVELYSVSEEVFNYNDSDRYDALSAADIINLQKILCTESKTIEE